MTLSEKLFIAGVATSAIALALAYSLGGLAVWSPVFVALGALWIVGQRRGQAWTAPLSLLGFIVGAVLGFWAGFLDGLLLLGVVMALGAWDLDDFVRRLQDVERDADVQTLERQHLLRLGIISGVGLLLGWLALNIRVTLNFAAIFALGLVAVFGLSRLVRQLWR